MIKRITFIVTTFICLHTIAQINCPQRIVMGEVHDLSQDVEAMVADQQRRIAQAQAEAMSNPSIGTLILPKRVLVIMTNFSDTTFKTSKGHADSIFNSTATLQTKISDSQVISHGSVASYFNDQSLGKYRPQFDVVGPINLSKSYAYYGQGANVSNHAPEMVIEACDSVAKLGLADFSLYDGDNDGYIDLVFVFFAGFGENDRDYIKKNGFNVNVDDLVWPHYLSSVGGSHKYNGKTLRSYECSNELDGYYSKAKTNFLVPAGSGILVHEFSHGMGLPDVYAKVSGNQTQFMGSWDLMDYGCYNGGTYVPAAYTGYQRWFCKWSSPKLMNEAKNDTLRPISTSGDFGVITASGDTLGPNSTTEYWIIENRQALTWDRGICGEGLILYHIQYHSKWTTSANANDSHNGYILVPADGKLRVWDSESKSYFVGKQDDCYPYNNLDSIHIVPNYPITSIKNEEGNITLKVCGGDPGPASINNNMLKEQTLSTKLFINGTLYIRRGNKLYTITGNETHLL